jgi:hypothetical protein
MFEPPVLDVRAAGIDADLADDGDRSVSHLLILAIGERLGRRHGDRVAGVDTHRVEVLDGANDDDVVGGVTHHLELVFLPAEDTLLDQTFASGGLPQRPLDESVEFVVAERDASPRTAQSETRPEDGGQLCLLENPARLLDRPRVSGSRELEADAAHRLAKLVAILRLVDGVELGPDQSDSVAVEDAAFAQSHGQIERRLSAEGRQQHVGPLGFYDLLHALDGHRLDVGPVRRIGIRHDRRRVRVHEDDPVALLAQRFAGLGSGVVELAGLADHDRSRPDQEDRFDVVAPGHAATPSAPVTASPARWRATISRKRAKR